MRHGVPLAMIALAAVALGHSGCQDKAAAPNAAGKAATPVSSAQVGEVEDQLKSALYQLQPEHLNIDSRLDDAVSVLNNWWAAVKEAGLKPQGLTPPELPEGRVSDAQRSALQRDSFGPEDGRAIHAAYFAKAVADQVTEDATGELDRIVKVFEWICRNIALDADDVSTRATTLYETLIVGHGCPADRAWVMGAVLKQLRWDLVILHPPGVMMEMPDAAWVAGVPHEGEIYLFDLRLGLPIPNGNTPDRPATLRQIIAHPDWLSALSPRSDQPYEPSAEQLKSAEVAVYTTPVSWSPRMWSVEQLLPGDLLCALYEPPNKFGDADGVFERVAKTGEGWTADRIQVWGYPADHEARYAKMDERAGKEVYALLVPFLMPVELREDRESKRKSLVQTMQQLQIRTDQLYGRRTDAVSQYVTIRQLAVATPPEQGLAPIYQQAADDAFYFSCVCKYEAGDLETAAKSLGDYVKRSRRGGRWGAAARSLLADCLAAQGNTTAAVQTVRAQESDDPYRARHAILINRWSAKPMSAEPAVEASAKQP
ncbi:MAG TPA: hypothetical protein VM165_07530 [Planctomycetaceae bacterium]|nr:hypothetical protein [Planctomycetaceae bacterium]